MSPIHFTHSLFFRPIFEIVPRCSSTSLLSRQSWAEFPPKETRYTWWLTSRKSCSLAKRALWRKSHVLIPCKEATRFLMSMLFWGEVSVTIVFCFCRQGLPKGHRVVHEGHREEPHRCGLLWQPEHRVCSHGVLRLGAARRHQVPGDRPAVRQGLLPPGGRPYGPRQIQASCQGLWNGKGLLTKPLKGNRP